MVWHKSYHLLLYIHVYIFYHTSIFLMQSLLCVYWQTATLPHVNTHTRTRILTIYLEGEVGLEFIQGSTSELQLCLVPILCPLLNHLQQYIVIRFVTDTCACVYTHACSKYEGQGLSAYCWKYTCTPIVYIHVPYPRAPLHVDAAQWRASS